MKIISHRGNLNGINFQLENEPNHITRVLCMGIDCEIDVWHDAGVYYLGHDDPKYKIEAKFLLQKGLWCHAKNLAALEKMLEIGAHCFWHQEDDFTLTSNGYIWTFPQKIVGNKSVIVDNNSNWKTKNYQCFGVCSDYAV